MAKRLPKYSPPPHKRIEHMGHHGEAKRTFTIVLLVILGLVVLTAIFFTLNPGNFAGQAIGTLSDTLVDGKSAVVVAPSGELIGENGIAQTDELTVSLFGNPEVETVALTFTLLFTNMIVDCPALEDTLPGSGNAVINVECSNEMLTYSFETVDYTQAAVEMEEFVRLSMHPAGVGEVKVTVESFEYYDFDGNVYYLDKDEQALNALAQNICVSVGQQDCDADSADGSIVCHEQYGNSFCLDPSCPAVLTDFDNQIATTAVSCADDNPCQEGFTCVHAREGSAAVCFTDTSINSFLEFCNGMPDFCAFKIAATGEKCDEGEGECKDDECKEDLSLFCRDQGENHVDMCEFGCLNDAECLDGQVCKDSRCEEVECTLDEHCSENQKCENNECIDIIKPAAQCGNNVVEEGEQCDDGNIESDDGCSSSCQDETPPEPPADDGGEDSDRKRGGGLCRPDWDCEDWSYCTNELVQKRDCIDQKRCGFSAPDTVRSCNACDESWVCTQWSECSGGSMTRTCSDEHVCGTTTIKPSEHQACDSGVVPAVNKFVQKSLPSQPIEEDPSFWDKYKWWILGAILAALLALALIPLLSAGHVVYNYTELVDWISQEMASGGTEEEIRTILKKETGWELEEIEDAFNAYKENVAT